MNKAKELIIKGKCFLGLHKWKNINDYFPLPKENETICFSNLHKCDNCGKEEYKGMGCV